MRNNISMYKKTWILWLAYLIAICILITLNGNSRTVTPSYFNAAINWFAGKNLYNGTGTDFIYLPTSAILYYPLTWFSFPISEIIWRALSVGVYAIGIFRFTQLATIDSKKLFFPIITILSLPIAFSSARNGQMNLILAGLSLLALVDIKDQRFWRATVFLCLSLALKPTAIVIFLLGFALFPPLRLTLLIGLLVVCLFPFITQSPHYVMQQYHDAWHMLVTSANLGTSENSWAQLFGLLSLLHIQVSANWQYLLRVIAAIITLLMCWQINKSKSIEQSIFYLFALSSIYLMLFNPRTENNDYAILVPAIGFLFAQMVYLRQKIKLALLVIIELAIIGGYTIGHWLTPGHVSWVTPLMACVFLLLVISTLKSPAPRLSLQSEPV